MAQRLLASIRKLPSQVSGNKNKRDLGNGAYIGINHCGDFGFPAKPSAITYDPVVDLFAITTKNGHLKIYGRAGVEFSAVHKEEIEVCKVLFIPEQPRVVTITGDNSVHLWELWPETGSRDVLVETYLLECVAGLIDSRASTPNLTAMCVTRDGRSLLLGTEGGCLAVVEVPSQHRNKGGSLPAEWSPPSPDQVIDPARVTSSFDSQHRKKLKFGAIVSILQSPSSAAHFLIGYSSGLCVVYDIPADRPVCLLPGQREMESVSWLDHRVTTSHDDGSLAIWSLEEAGRGGEARPEGPPNMPYGPFPCKTIPKIIWKRTKQGLLTIFSGGMPRTTYGDLSTLTLLREEDHLCLDLTSRLVDFVVLQAGPSRKDGLEEGEPHTLLVLLEEELVAVDLLTSHWPLIVQPYLNSLHTSAVTATHFVSQVPADFISSLERAEGGPRGLYSSRKWPIEGGKSLNNNEFECCDLLISGHEDGSVAFWHLAAGGCLRKVHTLYSSSIFEGGFERPLDRSLTEDIDEWPPFRRTGVFDPCSDDARLAVTCLDFVDSHLVVGCSGGQASVWRFLDSSSPSLHPKSISIDLIPGKSIWKGEPALKDKLDSLSTDLLATLPDLQPVGLIQLNPPSRITALCWHSASSILAVGSGYGLAAASFNIKTAEDCPQMLLSRCSLPDNATSEVAQGWARRRTRELKKSLRESFRRLRHLRSTTAGPDGSRNATARRTGRAQRPGEEDLELAHVEREVEARSSNTPTSAAVLCSFFGTVNIGHSSKRHSPSKDVFHPPACLFAGSGTSLAMTYALAGGKLLPWKEIQLRHMAPILHMMLLNSKTHLPVALRDDGTQGQELLIVTEEQVRIFSLPSLHLKHKTHMTAKDGFRIKMASCVSFSSVSPAAGDSTAGSCLRMDLGGRVLSAEAPYLLLTNNGGHTVILSLPNLRRIDTAPLIDGNDVLAVNSLCLINSRLGAAPPLGVYQDAPGQVHMFEIVSNGQRIGPAGTPYTSVCSVDRATRMLPPLTTTAMGDGSNHVTAAADVTNSSAEDSGVHLNNGADTTLPDSVRDLTTISSTEWSQNTSSRDDEHNHNISPDSSMRT